MNDLRNHTLLLVLVACAFLSTSAVGQPPSPTPDSVEANLIQSDWVTLYSHEQGVTEPVAIWPAAPLQSDCKLQKLDGRVKLSFVIDSNGIPRNLVFEQALANELDLLAIKLMLNAKFQPATLNGSPVAVGRSVEVHLQACEVETTDQSGKASTVFRLRKPAEEKLEVWRNAPTRANLAPITTPPGLLEALEQAHIYSIAPKPLIQPKSPDSKGHSGTFSFVVILDEHGIPQVREALKSTDQWLLPQVIQCVRNFRYQPARIDDMPVPTRITVGMDIKSQ
jgi:hypothetical protein